MKNPKLSGSQTTKCLLLFCFLLVTNGCGEGDESTAEDKGETSTPNENGDGGNDLPDTSTSDYEKLIYSFMDPLIFEESEVTDPGSPLIVSDQIDFSESGRQTFALSEYSEVSIYPSSLIESSTIKISRIKNESIDELIHEHIGKEFKPQSKYRISLNTEPKNWDFYLSITDSTVNLKETKSVAIIYHEFDDADAWTRVEAVGVNLVDGALRFSIPPSSFGFLPTQDGEFSVEFTLLEQLPSQTSPQVKALAGIQSTEKNNVSLEPRVYSPTNPFNRFPSGFCKDGAFTSPLPGKLKVVELFGTQRSRGPHGGTDYRARIIGTEVKAMQSGTVKGIYVQRPTMYSIGCDSSNPLVAQNERLKFECEGKLKIEKLALSGGLTIIVGHAVGETWYSHLDLSLIKDIYTTRSQFLKDNRAANKNLSFLINGSKSIVKNQYVEQGEVIALSGGSGAEAPHLHVEYRTPIFNENQELVGYRKNSVDSCVARYFWSGEELFRGFEFTESKLISAPEEWGDRYSMCSSYIPYNSELAIVDVEDQEHFLPAKKNVMFRTDFFMDDEACVSGDFEAGDSSVKLSLDKWPERQYVDVNFSEIESNDINTRKFGFQFTARYDWTHGTVVSQCAGHFTLRKYLGTFKKCDVVEPRKGCYYGRNCRTFNGLDSRITRFSTHGYTPYWTYDITDEDFIHRMYPKEIQFWP